MYAMSQRICECGLSMEKDLLCDVRMEEKNCKRLMLFGGDVGATPLASYGNALVDI